MNAREYISTRLLSRGDAQEWALAAVESYDAQCRLIDHTRAQSPVRGGPAVSAFWAEILAALPNCSLECVQSIAAERSVATRLRLNGRHVGGFLLGRPPAGNAVDVELCCVWCLAADRDVVVEQHLYYDSNSLDRQIARGVI